MTKGILLLGFGLILAGCNLSNQATNIQSTNDSNIVRTASMRGLYLEDLGAIIGSSITSLTGEIVPTGPEAGGFTIKPDGQIISGFTQVVGGDTPHFQVLISAVNSNLKRVDVFGESGRAYYNFAASSKHSYQTIASIFAQKDNKVVIVGENLDDNSMYLLRLLPNGSPDPTFNGGKPVVDNYAGNWCSSSFSNETIPADVTVRDDGRIVVVGNLVREECRLDTDAGYAPTEGFIAQFNPDGSLDPDFGDSGVLKFRVQDSGTALTKVKAVPGGILYVAGGSGDIGFVAKFLQDNTLDPSFQSGGLARIPDISTVKQFTLQNNKVIVLGEQSGPGSIQPVAIRLKDDGYIDRSFGVSGVFKLPVKEGFSIPSAIYVDPIDKSVFIATGVDDTDPFTRFNHPQIFKILSDGKSLDSKFGIAGSLELNYPSQGNVRFLSRNSSGQLIVAGDHFVPLTLPDGSKEIRGYGFVTTDDGTISTTPLPTGP